MHSISIDRQYVLFHRTLAYSGRVYPVTVTCGVRESVENFLIRCRRWITERRILAQRAGPFAAIVAPLVGGWDDYRDYPKKSSIISLKVLSIVPSPVLSRSVLDNLNRYGEVKNIETFIAFRHLSTVTVPFYRIASG